MACEAASLSEADSGKDKMASGHDTVSIESDLIGAVGRHEIVAYFQPQIDLATDAITSVEALSRWNHPELGVLTADAYIPIAEGNGLIHEIGDFMLDEGCRCASKWSNLGIAVDVAVNVSAAQLTTSEFFERLLRNLTRLDLAPQRMIVEITESLAIADHRDAARRLDHIRNAGVAVSIDDYGSGYSSLDQLMRLPATELKVDRSLVQRTGAGSDEQLAATIDLAHDMGLRVVAEGIETDAQLERVRDFGCDRAQGYLTGVALPETEVEQLLLAQV
jgi:EAL domain-containing protein (putative c-di-GMP-specific phosphodiesterase class I)